MVIEPQILVFTDLDGTLLDHHSYSFQPALPALQRLAAHNIPVILNSSKTRPEMEALKQQLGNTAPFIVENGAAAIIPPGNLGEAPEEILFAASRDVILEQLHWLRSKGYEFRGFNDMSAADVADVTGLTIQAATAAKQRIGTEPLMWQGEEYQLLEMKSLLEQVGLQLIKGGRFYHVMGQYDKADAMQYLAQRYQATHPQKQVISIALGDSPNDARMLERADYAVIIKGVNSAKLMITGACHVMRSQGEGPTGWNECIQSLLNQLLPAAQLS